MTRHLNDHVHNQKVYQSVPFKDGEKARILERKEKFDKLQIEGRRNLAKSYTQSTRSKDIKF